MGALSGVKDAFDIYLMKGDHMIYNVYCDESCHLQNDKSDVMVLGAMYCPENKKGDIFSDIRSIKEKYKLSSFFEIKWTKVSISKIDFYKEIFDYFFENEVLKYRGLIARGKSKLDHTRFNDGDYDLWYYKMYFRMIDPIISQEDEYKIFLDIKDTKGGKRIQKLKEVLCNNIYDFNGEVIKHIGQINSRESEILQMADLVNGALAYHHRGLEESNSPNYGKIELVNYLMNNYNIDKKTSRYASKFNLFIWDPKK